MDEGNLPMFATERANQSNRGNTSFPELFYCFVDAEAQERKEAGSGTIIMLSGHWSVVNKK